MSHCRLSTHNRLHKKLSCHGETARRSISFQNCLSFFLEDKVVGKYNYLGDPNALIAQHTG